MENRKQYIGYDYKTITVSRKFEAAWIDSYSSFGWELIRSSPAVVKPVWGPLRVMFAPLVILPGSFFKNLVMEHESADQAELYLKRDRNIKNKNELNRLQFSMENILNNMEQIERGKTFGASVAAYVTGLIGTIFMTLATFSYLASEFVVCMGFTVPGLLGWLLAAIVYLVVRNNKEKKSVAEIEDKFEEMNHICMQAYELLQDTPK